MSRMSGQVALVTGAASGIGAACARRLAAEGAAVVLMDIAGTSPVCDEIRAAGGRALGIVADVTTQDGWAIATQAAHAEFGAVGILVSNAFVVEVAAAHELSLASWERQLAVCLTGTFLGIRALLPDLREAHGAVVLISSVQAQVGLPGHPAYAAAKGGLVSLGRQLAVEYGPWIRVNTVIPGPILTPTWDRVPADERRRSIAQTVLGRFGEPDEVAAVVAFLASTDAAYVTGASLVVDGGWTAMKTSA